jgi:hypothetical protein
MSSPVIRPAQGASRHIDEVIDMNKQIKQMIGKVLNAASDAPNFFNLPDAERLNWMIAQAYILGQLSAARSAHSGNTEMRKHHEHCSSTFRHRRQIGKARYAAVAYPVFRTTGYCSTFGISSVGERTGFVGLPHSF